MAKKCIAGSSFCVENMTLFILCFILLLTTYMFFTLRRYPTQQRQQSPILIPPPNLGINISASQRDNNVFTNPFYPPLQPAFGIQSVPTQRISYAFDQIGIITKAGDKEGALILPLFGRMVLSNRNKWQYYTISNTGNINSKLPVRVKGRDAMSDNGVDELYNGDVVYVQGYNEIYTATIYENRGINYIPYL